MLGFPANRRHRPNSVVMLVHSLGSWPNITALEYVVFPGTDNSNVTQQTRVRREKDGNISEEDREKTKHDNDDAEAHVYISAM